ncbi:MAG: hypothetical protein ISR85_03160 [Kiritimatiellales bacterium]|nr:hypothetical protein [Kiritimatiellales bacterium]
MTFKENINNRLFDASNCYRKAIKLIVIPLISWQIIAMLLNGVGVMEKIPGIIIMPVMIAVMACVVYGFSQIFVAKRIAYDKLPCPGCGKELNYLLKDANYSKHMPWSIPKVLTNKVNACPHCHKSFEE